MQISKRDLGAVFNDIIRKYINTEKEINNTVKNIEGAHLSKVDFSEDIKIIQQQIKTANNKFTIATIGEFKAGKSTIINTILDLQGDKGLSCQFEPDTAKAIRILQKRPEQEYDAEIIYYEESGRATERVSWIDAKKFTSQVELENDSSLKEKAEDIDEVRYYIDNDLLSMCNFLDLPGTGYDPKHNRVTEAKINECDAVFWILSNTEEPKGDTIKNLQMIKHKIIPVINEWFDEESGEEIGDLTFEEVKNCLEDNFKAYLGDNEFIRYNAKAIEDLQQNGYSAEEEKNYGYNAMMDRLYALIYGEGVDLEEDKKKRLIDNVRDSCVSMQEKISALVSSANDYEKMLESREKENEHISSVIKKANGRCREELRDTAKTSAGDICEKLTAASILFIDDKMATVNIRTAVRSLTKKGKERLSEEYKQEYYRDYLEIKNKDGKDSWVSSVVDDFKDSIETLCINEYSKAGVELSTLNGMQSNPLLIDSRFFSTIADNMAIAIKQYLNEFLPVIVSGTLVYIPGHEVIDILLFLSSLTGRSIGNMSKKEDKVQIRAEKAKSRARLSISFQRVKLTDDFKKLGKRYNDEYKKELENRLKIKKDVVEKAHDAIESIYEIQNDVDDFMTSCRKEIQL